MLNLLRTTCLSELAARQHYAFTRTQALHCGWTAGNVEAAVRSDRWVVLHRGVYVEASIWSLLGPRERHLCLSHGRLLMKTAGWMVARRSAAIAHGLPLLGSFPVVPQLVRDHAGGRAKGKNRHERVATVLPCDRGLIDGMAGTELARTVVDLARSEALRNAVIAADASLRRGLDHAALLACAKRCSGWPGGLQGMRVATLADGLAESPLESLSRVAMMELELPRPELQIQVFLGPERIARVDNLWRDSNTIGQADGDVKYETRDDVLADKKQDDLLESLGFEVVRWGWQEAWRPRGSLDARILRGLERGRRQTLDPRVRLVVTTLEQSIAWARKAAS